MGLGSVRYRADTPNARFGAPPHNLTGKDFRGYEPHYPYSIHVPIAPDGRHMTFDGSPSVAKLARDIAIEHVFWMRKFGFSNTEIAESVGAKPYLAPNDWDVIELVARHWMRLRGAGIRVAA